MLTPTRLPVWLPDQFCCQSVYSSANFTQYGYLFDEPFVLQFVQDAFSLLKGIRVVDGIHDYETKSSFFPFYSFITQFQKPVHVVVNARCVHNLQLEYLAVDTFGQSVSVTYGREIVVTKTTLQIPPDDACLAYAVGSLRIIMGNYNHCNLIGSLLWILHIHRYISIRSWHTDYLPLVVYSHEQYDLYII